MAEQFHYSDRASLIGQASLDVLALALMLGGSIALEFPAQGVEVTIANWLSAG